MIRLEHGDWVATVALQGGAVAALTKGGEDVLRPTPKGATDILDFACFPLVPYANRIAQGRFVFDDREIRLPVLPRFAPHALHGEGWLGVWTVLEQAADRLTLSFGADGWPWRYEARQTFSLSDDGLRIDLSLSNRHTTPMPAGIGLHPYFPRHAETRLDAPATGVWTGEDIVPNRLAPSDAVFDWTDRAVADAPFVDNAYEGWSGEARLSDAAGTTIVRASADRLHVYVPTGEAFLCAEPVSHRPDVFNQAAPGEQGFTVLPPGETLALWMTIGRT
ncbi:MAG: aldose 1-epimerase [Caulobacteraceae bacterium]|nr:aldose 1-epimerase [Caulobacteraceae bacterium]